MKKILQIGILGVALISAYQSKAQQQVMFTQYMFNLLALNPAYAGSTEALSATFLSRHQWVGIDGAPNTQTLSVHSPIRKNKIALGLMFLRDKIGIDTQNGVFGSYAYRIHIGEKRHIAMGLQFGFTDFRSNFSEIAGRTTDPDPNFMSDEVRAFLPNIGTGFFYNTDRLYAGFSVPFLLNSFVEGSTNGSLGAEQVRHWFFMAGYVFDINHNLKLKPSGLLKVVKGAPMELDVNANLIIDDKVWVGLSWRSFDSIDLLFELQLNNQLKLGYAYDITTSALGRVNNGSHEFMLQYLLAFSKDRVVTPRYF
ncbi:MAG: type IX secretion system membrane protein PorP/SprF [Cyclobacteriaceae bacterium]